MVGPIIYAIILDSQSPFISTCLEAKVHEIPALQPVRRRSLSDDIIDQLVDLIARDELIPGQRIPSERELSRQLGVGRASLREALRSLAVMGIIEGRVGEGTFISKDSARYLEKSLRWGLLLDPKEIDDLIETRMLLETQTASFAAERATPDDLERLKATLSALEFALDDADRFLQEDLAFHLAIASASQNQMLHHLLQLTRQHLQAWITRSLENPPTSSDARARLSLRQHQDIHASIEARDPEAAASAMRRHLLSSSQGLTDLPLHPSDV
jgi:GntR family transcriptional repressor for pyruvate dehydrogenase complex